MHILEKQQLIWNVKKKTTSDGKCIYYDRNGKKDCIHCVNVRDDQGDGCTFCNGKSERVCTFCNGTGKRK